MKKFLLHIFLIFTFCIAFAQKQQVIVDWVDAELNNADNVVYLQMPSAKGFQQDFSKKGEFIFLKTFYNNGFNYSSAKVENINYETINYSELGNLEKDNIPNSFSYNLYVRNAGKKTTNTLSFTPIIKDGAVYKKIVSFDLTSSSEQLSGSNLSQKSLGSQEVINSVLATGEWFKFRIDTTGVYKVTPQFLSSLGMNLNGVDPNTIKIYGTGGQHLPYLNADNDSFDVKENPIQIFGAEDGVFANDDYLLFYGQGSKEFVAEDISHINPYTDDAFYYVTSGGQVSKKIIDFNENSIGSPTQTFASYNHYTFYEVDEYNLGNSGRRWFGDKFDSFNTSNLYTFELPELVEDANISVNVFFASIFGTAPQLLVNVSDSNTTRETGTLNFSNISTNGTFSSGLLALNTPFQNSILNIELIFQPGADITSEGFLDYITVTADCKLQGRNEQFSFSNILSVDETGEFVLGNAASISSVWNVTDPFSILKKDNNGADQFSVFADLSSVNKFAVVDEEDLFTPQTVSNSRVSNQNIKSNVFLNSANQFEAVDYLIITNENFLTAASRLASFRRQNDGFNVKVVDVQSIYNEFGTGSQDVVAIRNFVKYVYENSIVSNEESELKYLCIIGDGSYDLKNRISNNSNHVPLYHSTESSSVTSSYATDDFYTFFDADEGATVNTDKMDVAVGRILARDASEASTMVDKIINFHKEDAFGDWRNSMLFVSDDVDQDFDAELQDKIVEVSGQIENAIPRANIKRLIMDAFEQESTSAGERYSIVSERLLQFFNRGVSFLNYFGHGGEDGITGEFVFTSEMAQQLTNEDRLPVFVTLTCELTRFDNPNRNTAGEFLYWNKVGGAIGLLTTTRQLTLSTGIRLNSDLVNEIFDENTNARAIGDILKLLKETNSTSNARTVFCIGDPAIKMALPNPQVLLTGVNNMSIDAWRASGNPIKALDRVTLLGKVVDGITGDDLPNYNGEATITVFDKDVERTTLANDGTRDNNNELIVIDFTESGSLVFKGLSNVTDGEFSMEFILPKNVQLEEGEGKVSFYVEAKNQNDDQSGASDIIIGGLNEEAEEDNTAPLIELFLNDETFFSGQVVGSSPLIFAKLSDESGINTAGGVGHDIQIIIDGNETEPISANEFYITNVDDFTSGTLNYQLNDLEPGEHTIQLRVSDTHNNSSIQEVSFVVAENRDFILNNVLNYPNPFVSYTEFWFSHSSIANDTLEVSLQIMTVTGKVVTTKHITLSGKNSYMSELNWDSRDNFGNKLGKGVYLYKIIAKSTLTNNTATKIEKLVLL